MKKKIVGILILMGSLIAQSNAQRRTPTELELYDSLVARGFCAPDVVWRIAIWETGHLKSNLCVNHNNLFGIRLNSREYRHFNSWLDCLDYMDDLWNRRYDQFVELGLGGDEYYFLQWWGYKSGHSLHPSEAYYVSKIKSLRLPEPYRWVPPIDDDIDE